MHPMLNIAVRAARRAGTIITQHLSNPSAIETIQKGQNDFVTNVDKQAEAAIIEVIQKAYPEHTIIGEESGQLLGSDDSIQWVIDPLDGTTNFVKGFPHFAVSIAARQNGRTEVAVVYDPIRNELFTAVRGQGAQLNGYRLRMADLKSLEGTVIATGFPFKYKQFTQNYISMINALFAQCADFRRTGCASLDLAYVACGRVDGYFEIGLKPWDFMAGDLIIREAGGVITDFVGDNHYLDSGNLVAGNAKIVRGILTTIREFLGNSLSR